ncbi:MAG: D-tyrosyl-tRNA(Tyr) deacylase [Clostridiales bacterium]|nr:D-tyrosyl-tRNA(Tyr) deacylase [Clostridiales bacterium]
MKAVIQRVKSASVKVEGKTVGEIEKGYLILVGVVEGDDDKMADLLAEKTAKLRVFCDENDKMNKSVTDIDGEILVVSQFTLCADCRKGNRPSFSSSAAVDEAERLYERYAQNLKNLGIRKVEKGVFGADMEVSLINDGPVTIIFDTDIWKSRG